MNCDTIRELFSSYIDDQLNEHDRRQVEQHLAACPDCARELALLRQTVEMAAGLDELELPEGFHAGLAARLAQADAEIQTHMSSSVSVSRSSGIVQGVFGRVRAAMRRPAWRGALVTAAACVLVFAVVNQAIPGWDGNLWSLLRSGGFHLSAAREPGDTGTEGLAGTRSIEAPLGDWSTRGQEAKPNAPAPPSEGGEAGLAERTAPTGTDTLKAAGLEDAQIIQTATVTVEVKDFVAAEGQVSSIVAARGGYIEQSSLSLQDKVKSGWWRIRIPQDRFNEAIAEFEKMGTVKRKDLGAEDVAGTIVDLQARTANLRRQELRLGELLGQAKTLDEVLRVENELNRVRYQVESYEGQLKWFQNRVAMSTIQLNLSEPGEGTTPPIPGADLWRRIWAAFVATWKGIGSFLGGLVVFVASVAPVALILVAAWVGYRRWRAARAAGTGKTQ